MPSQRCLGVPTDQDSGVAGMVNKLKTHNTTPLYP
jgi:hypothetical protein